MAEEYMMPEEETPQTSFRPTAGRHPMLPIASLMRAIGGYDPNAPVGQGSLIPRLIDRAEQFAADLFTNPGAGRLGTARTPSFNLGGRQLTMINEIENWLNRSGINYNLNMNRSGASTVYIYARHPHTNEQVAIRVPRDGRMGFVDQRSVAKYKDTNRADNFFDIGDRVTKLDRPLQPEFTGNRSGEPYHNLDTLFDALSHRFSRNPSGQFLVPPGREPHYPSERLTPIPMTQFPIAYGTRGVVRNIPPPLNQPQISGLVPRRVVLPPRQPRQLDLFR